MAADPINLYDGPPPGSESWSHEEQAYYSDIFATEVVTNVSQPSITPFIPQNSNGVPQNSNGVPENGNGAAVIVAPGGGFHALSINSEGNDVARWLNKRGIAAFVLRYRLVPSGEEAVAEMMRKSPEKARADMAEIAPMAGADGLRALELVHARADEFGVDVDRLGFMGFSAGGAVAVTTATRYSDHNRPAFVAPIYASVGTDNEVKVPADAPPLFLLAATDDQLGLASDSVALYNKWLNANKSVEMHLFAAGGHGFGMRTQNLPADDWISLFGDWLDDRGFMEER